MEGGNITHKHIKLMDCILSFVSLSEVYILGYRQYFRIRFSISSTFCFPARNAVFFSKIMFVALTWLLLLTH